MAAITKPVGGAIPNLNRQEVKLIQQLLNKHRKIPLSPIAEDGLGELDKCQAPIDGGRWIGYAAL